MVPEDIKYSIKVAGFTQSEIAEKLGISKEHLGRLIKDGLPDHYVEMIKNLGIDIIVKSQKDDIKEEYNRLKLAFDYQNKLMDSLEKRIIDLTRENITLNKLVNLGIDRGILSVKN